MIDMSSKVDAMVEGTYCHSLVGVKIMDYYSEGLISLKKCIVKVNQTKIQQYCNFTSQLIWTLGVKKTSISSL